MDFVTRTLKDIASTLKAIEDGSCVVGDLDKAFDDIQSEAVREEQVRSISAFRYLQINE